MTAEIRVPRENVNDDTVRLVRWLVADGAELRRRRGSKDLWKG